MKRYTAVLLSVALATASSPALRAEEATAPGFALSRFEPSERGSRFFSLESLDWRGDGRPVLGLVGDYAYKPLVLYGRSSTDPAVLEERVVIARHHLLGHLGGSLNIGRDYRVGLDLPVVFYGDGTPGQVGLVTYRPPQTSAAGDMRLSGDWRFLGAAQDAFRMALGLKAFLPTGDPRAYAGDGQFRALANLQAAGEAGPFTFAGRVGISYRALETAFSEGSIGTEATAALSAGVRLMDNRLFIGPELTTATRLGQQFFSGVGSPVDLLVGGRYDLDTQWRVGAAVGKGFTPAFGEPSFRAVVALEWVPAVAESNDTDGDGISDALDVCPRERGVASCQKAGLGCPVRDSDGDGLTDDQDGCPLEPETKNGVRDEDGCPDSADRDQDGIPDERDRCPAEPEDRDGFEDDDGCLDPDNDRDGILDTSDQCRDVPETMNGIKDQDGCPDGDRDGDGIADDEDACSYENGIASSDPAKHGCPSDDRDGDTVPNIEDICADAAGLTGLDRYINGCPTGTVINGRLVLDKIEFERDQDVIKPASEKVLESVLEAINKLSPSNRYRIEGHTDSRAGRKHNIDLARRRARSVIAWLVEHGISAKRLVAAGYGPDRPVATNATDAGRQANRRVEIHLHEGSLETDGSDEE